MTTTRATNSIPAPVKQPKVPMRHDLKRQETWSGGRSSLDVPRRPWAWDDPGGTFQLSQQTPRVSSTSTIDFQDPNILPCQRPLSTGPSSPQRHLSATSTQYLSPPPKSLQLNLHSLTSPPPVSAPLTPIARQLRSQNGKPVEQGLFPTDCSKLELSQYALVPERPLQKINSSKTVPNGGFKRIFSLPPPVNRADKPKILMKQAPDSRLADRTCLEPGESSNPNRLSPFSTSPSNEGSPGIETPHEEQTTVLAPTKATKAAKISHHESYFRPPLIHRSSDEKLSGYPGNSLSGKWHTDPRLNGFSQEGQPPGLPPRRDNNNFPKASTNSARNVPKSRRNEDQMDRHRPLTSASKLGSSISRSTMKLLPPPKRVSLLHEDPSPSINIVNTARKPDSKVMHASSEQQPVLQAHIRLVDICEGEKSDCGNDSTPTSITNYPDVSQVNRRPPRARGGTTQIETKHDTRLFDICGRYVCASGYLTRAWDVVSGDLILNLSPGEKEVKVTSMAFKPGATAEEEGMRIWLGTNYGDIQEIDIPAQNIVQTRSGAHARREIIKIYRHQNSMWSLDDNGNLLVWIPDDRGLPSLQRNPKTYKVSKGCTFSIIIKDYLWLATGKDIRIFNPNASEDMAFHVLQHPLTQHGTGEVTSGAVISSQLQKVYFGHTDGKVTIYSTTGFHCLGIINVSVYKISSLAGAGFYLWAGYNTGMMYVYDTRTEPWLVKKDWRAHDNPITGILVDRSSVWKLGRLQVASIGLDNSIKIWDGMLEEDWLEADMQEHDTEYCGFREIKTVVVSWNAGATTPASLRFEDQDSNFFREVIQVDEPPDILVFGFQELVDLDDKKLTAKSLLMGNKKKDSSEQEHMSRQYRAWRDYLVRVLEDNMPTHEHYHLLHTASMVGLFSCVFVKASERTRIRNLQAAEVKRGIGGLHGNKGALIMRFCLDDTSLCFTNCHLAAGQTQTVNRNNDVAAILETAALPLNRESPSHSGMFIGGGDGAMIMDHEICVLNGDLNYRIDTMGRDTVIKAVKANNLSRLLERDQLLVSRRRNPGFRLRAFNEAPITFAPTYKYDVGSDKYDTSEKHRSPAWCDRVLYRGAGRIKQLHYQRHELRISDHRPVSGTFKMRIKSILPDQRLLTWQQCEARFQKVKQTLAREAQIDYLVSVLGIEQREAQSLINQEIPPS